MSRRPADRRGADARFAPEDIEDLRLLLSTAMVCLDNNMPWNLSIVARKIKEICDDVMAVTA